MSAEAATPAHKSADARRTARARRGCTGSVGHSASASWLASSCKYDGTDMAMLRIRACRGGGATASSLAYALRQNSCGASLHPRRLPFLVGSKPIWRSHRLQRGILVRKPRVERASKHDFNARFPTTPAWQATRRWLQRTAAGMWWLRQTAAANCCLLECFLPSSGLRPDPLRAEAQEMDAGG